MCQILIWGLASLSPPPPPPRARGKKSKRNTRAESKTQLGIALV